MRKAKLKEKETKAILSYVSDLSKQIEDLNEKIIDLENF